jgi:Uncharacterized conserved protein
LTQRATAKIRPYIPPALPFPLDWEALVPFIGAANRALATFDGVLYGMPNAELLLSPLTTQEAVLSSRIEGTQATFGEVLKFEAGEEPAEESRRLDIQEILNYRNSLQVAERELHIRPFNLNLLLELHSVLLDSVRGRDKGRGRFRNIQNWIGRAGSRIEEATYVPPEPALLGKLLDNWEKYYHADDRDPLVQLALLHGQFEIIHPFVDGNGRIGRILIPVYLFEKELLSRPVFYLSAYLEEHKEEYIARLAALSSRQQAQAWSNWVKFFLTAVTEQAKKNLKSARQIIDLYERSKVEMIGITQSRYAVPLLDILFERPVFSPGQLEGRSDMPSKQMIMSMLGRLKNAGILQVTRQSSGRRPQILAFRELVNLSEGQESIRRPKIKRAPQRSKR